MLFRITGLSPDPFRPLFGLSERALASRGMSRHVADRSPGFPCRIEMRDADPGETMLLLNHVSQPAATAYRASHAIFVREGATARFDAVGIVPAVLRRRLLSVRAFDAAGSMRDADVTEGVALETLVARLFADPLVDVLHVHNAKRGCYAGRIERA